MYLDSRAVTIGAGMSWQWNNAGTKLRAGLGATMMILVRMHIAWTMVVDVRLCGCVQYYVYCNLETCSVTTSASGMAWSARSGEGAATNVSCCDADCCSDMHLQGSSSNTSSTCGCRTKLVLMILSLGTCKSRWSCHSIMFECLRIIPWLSPHCWHICWPTWASSSQHSLRHLVLVELQFEMWNVFCFASLIGNPTLQTWLLQASSSKRWRQMLLGAHISFVWVDDAA